MLLKNLNNNIHLQVACGPKMEMLDIVVRHPGSTHDNTIFERSSLRLLYENHEVPGKFINIFMKYTNIVTI